MIEAIKILQLVSALFLALLILIQSRGDGLSATFGGSGGFYATKRGAEKVIAIMTIITLIAFLVLSFFASVL